MRYLNATLGAIAIAALGQTAQAGFEARFGAANITGLDLRIEGLGLRGAPAFDGSGTRQYDDGFVGTDAFGNSQGLTSNWGYQDASQLSLDRQVVLLHAVSSPSDLGATLDDNETAPGFEFGLSYIFAERDQAGFGLNFSVARVRIEEDYSVELQGSLQQVQDAYAYQPLRNDFIAAAPPGYGGSPTGLGPLLSTDPVRTIRVLEGARSVDALVGLDLDLTAWELGAFYDFPVVKGVSLRPEAGFMIVQVRGDASVSETVVLDSVSPVSQASDFKVHDNMAGFYFGLGAHYRLTSALGLYVSARYQHLDEVLEEADSYSIIVDGSETYSFRLGVEYSF